MNDELRQAIAAFVAASARFCLAEREMRSRRRAELHTTWFALRGAWDRNPP